MLCVHVAASLFTSRDENIWLLHRSALHDRLELEAKKKLRNAFSPDYYPWPTAQRRSRGAVQTHIAAICVCALCKATIATSICVQPAIFSFFNSVFTWINGYCLNDGEWRAKTPCSFVVPPKLNPRIYSVYIYALKLRKHNAKQSDAFSSLFYLIHPHTDADTRVLMDCAVEPHITLHRNSTQPNE